MLIRRSGFTHSFQSQKLFIFSWSVQFFSNLRKHRSAVLTFVLHGEQTLVEKDSPFSRKTKSLFFSRSATFGNIPPFRVGATNTFSEFIHPLLKLPNCVLKLYNLSEALGSFGLFSLRGADTGYVGSWRTATSTHFWSSTIYTTFRIGATPKTASELQRQDNSKQSADDINTRSSRSKSITECIKFTKRVEL